MNQNWTDHDIDRGIMLLQALAAPAKPRTAEDAEKALRPLIDLAQRLRLEGKAKTDVRGSR